MYRKIGGRTGENDHGKHTEVCGFARVERWERAGARDISKTGFPLAV